MQNSLSKLFILFSAIFICSLRGLECNAQSLESDVEHLTHYNYFVQEEIPKKKIKWFQAINPLYWVYKGSIGFYQKNISVQIAANCVFETTCSRFSKKLTEEFGVIGGTILSIERLSRCNRVTLVESSPLEKNEEGKIVEDIEDYHIH